MKLIQFLFIISIAASCGPTTTGNPLHTVTLRMEDRQPFGLLKKGSELLIPSAHAAVSNVKFCFKRLRFKPDETIDGTNVDLAIGEVEIDPNGTFLTQIKVPKGTYRRIEFDLDKECDQVSNKPSVSLTNGIGTFSTQDSITIKFEGSYSVSGDGTLILDVDSLFDAMDTVTASAQIKTSLEGSTGDF